LASLYVISGGNFYSTAAGYESHAEFIKHLKASADIVFPVIHGQFGEDGGIQVTFHLHIQG
jgi:D-alanine-D-alanine ligase-like ATP-grasp enzyme